MKPKKIIYLEKILRFMAKAILWKYKPKIVGITGSVGKTSTKEAIFVALSSGFKVRKNEKNYNNEIGIPLTIIGAESGDGSFLKWLGVFLKWLAVFIFPVNYPEILGLEMGVDRPGYGISFDFYPSDSRIITNISEPIWNFQKHRANPERKRETGCQSSGRWIGDFKCG